MRAFVGLQVQRDWRDLRLLPADLGRWVDAAGLAEAQEPAVICAAWASEAPEAADVLRRRRERRSTTVLVPRFHAGPFRAVLGAPVEIEVAPAETHAVTWHDGTIFEVPATSAVHTALPAGQWGRSEGRTTVFAWRPHTQAGWTILCTPTVAGRALGADAGAQLGLLERILDEADRSAAAPSERAPTASIQPAASARDYLARHGELGALALLAWWAAPGPSIDEGALARLGVRLDPLELRRLGQALPPLEPGEVEETLRAAGWGAHLRVLEQRPAEET